MTLGEANRVRFDGESWALVHHLSFGAHRDQFRQSLCGCSEWRRPGRVVSHRTRRPRRAFTRVVDRLHPQVSFPAMQVMFDRTFAITAAEGRSAREADADLPGVAPGPQWRCAQARTRLEGCRRVATVGSRHRRICPSRTGGRPSQRRFLLFEKGRRPGTWGPTIPRRPRSYPLLWMWQGKDGPSPAAILHANRSHPCGGSGREEPRVLADLRWML